MISYSTRPYAVTIMGAARTHGYCTIAIGCTMPITHTREVVAVVSSRAGVGAPYFKCVVSCTASWLCLAALCRLMATAPWPTGS